MAGDEWMQHWQKDSKPESVWEVKEISKNLGSGGKKKIFKFIKPQGRENYFSNMKIIKLDYSYQFLKLKREKWINFSLFNK